MRAGRGAGRTGDAEGESPARACGSLSGRAPRAPAPRKIVDRNPPWQQGLSGGTRVHYQSGDCTRYQSTSVPALRSSSTERGLQHDAEDGQRDGTACAAFPASGVTSPQRPSSPRLQVSPRGDRLGPGRMVRRSEDAAACRAP